MKEIIINKEQDKKQILVLENNELVEKYTESDKINRIEGNIYVGEVKDVLQGMQAAFIDIGLKKNTFIHLKDALPKVDVVKEKQELENKNVKRFLKPGIPILVQVKKDFTNSKGAKVSTHISLNSRYIVFMPNTDIITISKKIEDEAERERLINIAQTYLPKHCGAILRTAADGQTEEQIKTDIALCASKWKRIHEIYQEATQIQKYPKLIYKTHGIIKKLLIDLMDKDLTSITTNTKEDYDYITKLLADFKVENIQVNYVEGNLLEDKIDLNKQIEKAENRKVWLKCGGFISIDKTEALTAIDVNSGKYIGKDNAETTVLKVNKQASIEIAKQLRLRDIGGIIIIDYIDMQLDESKQAIVELLEKELSKDRSKTQVVGFSKLNLLEMTRKHICSNE